VPDEAFLTLAPDWVCQVLSPSTAMLDRAKKLRIYAREGVGHAWVVDPIAQLLEVLRLEAGRWVIAATFAGAKTVRAEPFAGVPLELGLLWTTGASEAKSGTRARRRRTAAAARRTVTAPRPGAVQRTRR
jgi:Uma2 family endonuclease